MKSFIEKYSDSFDEKDIIDYIKKKLHKDSYRRGYNGSGSGSGMNDGNSTYHHDGMEEELKQLALVAEMIQDLFHTKGLDIKSYLTEDNFRRR